MVEVDFKGVRVLITGGIGFIGSSLARRLVIQGADVTLVDSLIPEYGGNLYNIRDIRDRLKVNISDVRDPYSMRYLIQGQDYLFNLAGQTSHLDSMQDPHADLAINVSAQLSILEACRHHNPDIKILFAGTRQIYGKPDYLPVDESHPIRPVDVNGINKTAGEWYHLLYNTVYGVKACVLRLTNTYGPGMRVKDARQTFLGIWVRNLVEDRPILVYGDGSQLRDFNYVEDVVNAMLVSAVSPDTAGKVYNLGGQERISLKEVADMMITISGKGSCQIVPFPEERKAIDIGDYYSDYSRIASETGWRPATSLKDGLKETIKYYAERLEYYL